MSEWKRNYYRSQSNRSQRDATQRATYMEITLQTNNGRYGLIGM